MERELIRERFKHFTERYLDNGKKMNSWNEQLLGQFPEEAWISILTVRAASIRDIYVENEAMIDELYAVIDESSPEVVAELLLELVRNLTKNGMDDQTLIANLCERALSYYDNTADYDSRIMLNSIRGSALSVFYRLIRDPEGAEKALEAYRRIIDLGDHFWELKDPDAKRAVLDAYLNLVTFTANFHDSAFVECCGLCLRAIEFSKRDDVNREAEADPGFAKLLKNTMKEIYSELIACTAVIYVIPDNEFAHLNDIYYQYVKPLRETGELDPRTDMIARLIWDRQPEEEWLNDFASMLENGVPWIDYGSPDQEAELEKFIPYHQMSTLFLEYIKSSDFPRERKMEYARRVFPGLGKMIWETPYPFQTEKMNTYFVEWFHVIEPFLETDEEKRDFLSRLLIMRQPVTFIHCRMVEKIVELMGSEVLSKRPELFIGICGLETKEDVIANKKVIMNFLHRCSIIHDVGKCFVTDIINRQSRALTDIEFQLIKLHPSFGTKIAKVAALEPYADVIRGHHKFYNGQGGYPEDYDNTVSPLRFVTDLVTVADSIDAATDVLGRNYSRGKDFTKLFEELKEGAGTRYNPDVIDIIAGSPTLFEAIRRLTGNGRYAVYRDCYKAILKI